ncbi:MAG TPA: DNA primase [Candidatus Baltobacteraceae bacterium]|nr:DNA primase [Candidatus Baltobacteraceae bacterium]
MRVDDGVKREILARTDIGEVIGSYVTLRKRGNDLVGLCPFHGEKSPSFHVHPDRGFFKCFGCGAGGDALSFLQKHENVGFVDAMRILAKRAGVELESEDPRAARARNERESIYHANDVARAWFHRMLLDARTGAQARAYCEGRGISRETIEAFSLGYAPESWDGLVDELRRNDVDLALAAKAGLVKPSQRGGFYDFYRDRLMIPTLAITGETVAFGGRALGDAEPKYLNTSTTPVYTKGRHLFALNVARRAAAKEDAAIVVEGYLDCIALHQAGFANAVAALGTAFTPEQARELRKSASRALLCFDADAAGIDAALKSIDVLAAEGVDAWSIRVPDGKDPDEFVRRNGAAAFAALLDKPVPATQVKIDAEIARRRGKVEDGRLARWAEETIHRLAPREEWDRWRVYVAGRLGLAVDDLRKSRLLVTSAPVAHAPPSALANASRHFVPATAERPSFEREVLSLAIDEPALVGEFGTRIAPDAFENRRLRDVWARMLEHASSLTQPSDVWALFSEDEEARSVLVGVSGLVRLADPDARRAKLERVVDHLDRDAAQRRRKTIDAEMVRLSDAGLEIPAALRAEHNALAARLKKG